MDLESKYNAAVAALALMREQRDQALDQCGELNQDAMLTTAEVAALLGMTDRAIRAHIKAGNIKGVMHGRDWGITAEEVERFKVERRPAHRPKRKDKDPRSL